MFQPIATDLRESRAPANAPTHAVSRFRSDVLPSLSHRWITNRWRGLVHDCPTVADFVQFSDESGLLHDSISGFGLDLQSKFPCPRLFAEFAFGREEEFGELRPSGVVVAATLKVERALNGVAISFACHEIRARAAQRFKGRGESP